MKGISIAIIPCSWAWGPWNLKHKWLFAVGPLRFVYHRNVSAIYSRYGEQRSMSEMMGI